MDITVSILAENLQRLIDMGHGELKVKGYDGPWKAEREYDGCVYGHEVVTLKFK